MLKRVKEMKYNADSSFFDFPCLLFSFLAHSTRCYCPLFSSLICLNQKIHKSLISYAGKEGLL